jgi:eukaryotic-like serine/threonine-protein kinase
MRPDPPNADSLFLAAAGHADPRDRAMFLDEACRGNQSLRNRVERLLAAQSRVGSFLESPAPELGPTVDQPLAPETSGTQIGPYKLREQIGEGGFGVVYVAEQEKPVARKVALKIIKPGMDTRDVIARFEAERQALALMDHPNIAKVLDAGTTGGNPKSESRNPKETQKRKSESQRPDDNDVSDIRNSNLEFPSDFEFRDSNFRSEGRPYFVMELVRGVPITEFCDERKLTTRERLALFIDVCRAVQHAHQKGIIHRDIKPSNVMVTLRDDKPIPKVIDFGVSKALSSKLTEKTIYTAYGQIIGTPLYMSPEQAQMNEIDVDTRSDVYSLGVLLYELLTGTTPFDKDTLQKSGFDEMRRIIREVDPPRPSARISTLNAELLSTISERRHIDPRKLGASLRGELDWITMKALEKDRNRRYESAGELADDVRRYLNDDPVEACPPSAWYRFRKFARKRKIALIIIGLVGLVVLTLAGSVGWMAGDQIARQQRLADQVKSILDEVDRLARKQAWSQALAEAKRAEPVLESGDADAATEQRIRQTLVDLKFVRRLDEIRLLRNTSNADRFDSRAADRAYAAAFQSVGVDVDGMPADEAATALRSHALIAVGLAAALDDWSDVRRCTAPKGDECWRRQVAVAKLVDPDLLRNHLRDLRGENLTAKARSELKKLAADLRLGDRPAATLKLLATTLIRGEMTDEAIAVLRRAHNRYPSDFWINFGLGSLLSNVDRHALRLAFPPSQGQGLGFLLSNVDRHAQATRYYTAASALRPTSAAVQNNLGIALMHQGRVDAAVTAYRRAIELDRDLVAAHNNLAFALLAQRKLEAAAAACRAAITIDAGDATAHNTLGLVLRWLKKPDEAKAHYHKAIELDPTYALPWVNLGNMLRDKGRLDEAIQRYHKAIAVNAKLGGAYNALGAALELKGKLDEAIKCYRKAIELDPTDETAHYDLGGALQKQGKPDEAIAAARRAIELDPKYSFAYVNLGNALVDKGRLVDAVAAYRKSIELDSNHAVAHYNLGRTFKRLRKLDEAVACFRKAIALDAKLATAHNSLGIALNEKGKLVEATRCFRKAIELDEKLGSAYLNLGKTLRSRKRLEEAIDAYRKAVKLLPKDAPAHYSLGAVLAEKGLRKESLRWFRKAVEIDPKNALARNNLAGALLQMGRLDEAIAEYVTATKLDPNDPLPFINLAKALRSSKRFKEAAAACRKAIAIRPDSAPAHHVLGAALAATGSLDQAVASFRRAIELDPGYALSHYAIGLIMQKRRRLDESVASLRTAVRLSPGFLVAQYSLGNTLCMQKKWREAEAPFRKAIALKPDWGLAHYSLGYALQQQHKVRESAAAYREAIRRLNPKTIGQLAEKRSGEHDFYLAAAYALQGDKQRSRQYYVRAVKWMEKDKQRMQNADLRRVRGQVERLLGIPVAARPPRNK